MKRAQAIALAARYEIPLNVDFHTLPLSTIERIIAAADECKYRQPRNANGSRSRYFHAYLVRSLRKIEDHGIPKAPPERGPGEKFYAWTVRIEIDAVWVADGFNLTAERMHAMLAQHLSSAGSEELRAKVIKAPDPKAIRREQGAKD